MKKYFIDTKAYNVFRALGAKVPGPQRIKFYKAVFEAYQAKQTSPVDLASYQLSSDEVQVIWNALPANRKQHAG